MKGAAWRFSLRRLALAVLLCSLLLALWSERQRHLRTQAALGEALLRDSWGPGLEATPAGAYRLLVHRLYEQDGTTIARLRIETSSRRHLQVIGSVTGVTESSPEQPQVFWAELLIVYVRLDDHNAWYRLEVRSPNQLAATNDHYQQPPVPQLELTAEPGVYDQPVTVAVVDGFQIKLAVP